MKKELVTNFESLTNKIEEMRKAQEIFATYTQEQVDKIFHAAALAINNNRIQLAQEAVAETGMGLVEDKIIKNHVASEFVYNKYKYTKTVGTIAEDVGQGTITIAEPVGIVSAVIPTTNPTSTAAFKVLISLKTRNAIFIAPHPRAKNCTIHAAQIAIEAAEAAGAPKGLLGWIDGADEGINPIDLTTRLMQESDLILATGGPGMVKSAYSSGTPALGVGAGNTPIIFDETADIELAVSSVIHSKSFDYGVICASEQSVMVPASKYEAVRAEFSKRGAYILNPAELKKVKAIILTEDGALNGKLVGQSPQNIAKLAGIKIPDYTKIIIGEVSDTSQAEPFAHEKLSILLAMYKYDKFEDGLEMAKTLVKTGLGHTSGIYAHEIAGRENVEKFYKAMRTCRVLLNQPASHGAVGDVYNFGVNPSLTLGCGTWGGNAVSENVGPLHLLQTKVVTKRRENMLWFKVPEKIYYKLGSMPVALTDLKEQDIKKVFIVTDHYLHENGFVSKVTTQLKKLGIQYSIYSGVQPDPTIENVIEGTKLMESFQPDCIIALGGGSPMDAAKIMWTFYEQPDINFKDITATFLDMTKRICKFPKMGEKAYFVAIPTTAGTGSEVTPFAVITDTDGTKYPLADYALTPHMAIVDPEFMLSSPKSVTSAAGIDVLVHAIESHVSVVATNYTKPLSLEAIQLTFDNLAESYHGGADAIKAKENMANASTLAGMAFANAFLGICHSLAHKMGAQYHIPHGIANALLISEVIKFNATDKPFRMGTFSQYEYPQALERYAQIARMLGLSGKDNVELTNALIAEVEKLKAELNIPKSIKEWGISEEQFMADIDMMCVDAFDDQCTGANPRYPQISELKEIYLRAFHGENYKGTKTYEVGK